MVSVEVGLGLAFVLVGIALLLLEASSPGFFVGVPATILVALGLLALLFPDLFFSPWSPVIAVLVGAPMTYLTFLLYQRIAPPGPPTTTVGTSLVGRTGRVVRKVDPETIQGKVNIGNQVWSARTEGDEPIEEGVRVRVVASQGVHVVVVPLEAPAPGLGREKEVKES